jgi:hypothetical protein
MISGEKTLKNLVTYQKTLITFLKPVVLILTWKTKGLYFHLYKTKKTGNIIKVNSLTTDLYVRCNILNYGIRIHRIAAQAFIPNPRNCIDVDHIDGNILNYCLDNLRWVSRSENMKKINRNDVKYQERQNKLKKKGDVYY